MTTAEKIKIIDECGDNMAVVLAEANKDAKKYEANITEETQALHLTKIVMALAPALNMYLNLLNDVVTPTTDGMKPVIVAALKITAKLFEANFDDADKAIMQLMIETNSTSMVSSPFMKKD